MAKDVFISHSSKDAKLAVTICRALEDRGIGCWIAPRDIDPGQNFQEAIVRAIRQAKTMILVFSSNTNESAEVKKELVLASQNRLAVIPLRIEDVVPSEAFAYELSTRQWIDLFHDWETAVSQVGDQIKNVLGIAATAGTVAPKMPARRGAMPAKAWIAAAVVVVVAALGGVYAVTRGSTPSPAPLAGVVPAAPTPPPAPATGTGDLAFWNSIKDETTTAPFDAYLKQFPTGQFAALARLKRSEIATQDAATSLTAVFDSCPAAHSLAGGDALPGDLDTTMKVGAALIVCGTASWQGREFPTGKKQLTTAIDIFTQLVAQAPNRNEFSGDLALSHERYGRILHAEGDLDGAIRESRQDVALRSNNLRKFPNNIETKTALAMSEFVLAGMLKQRGNLDAAKEAYGRCATLRGEAIAGHGTNPLLQGPLKTCQSAMLQFGSDTATTDDQR